MTKIVRNISIRRCDVIKAINKEFPDFKISESSDILQFHAIPDDLIFCWVEEK